MVDLPSRGVSFGAAIDVPGDRSEFPMRAARRAAQVVRWICQRRDGAARFELAYVRPRHVGNDFEVDVIGVRPVVVHEITPEAGDPRNQRHAILASSVRSRFKRTGDGQGDAIPLGRFLAQAPAAGSGQFIVLRTAVVL